jgi:hypothetical protein
MPSTSIVLLALAAFVAPSSYVSSRTVQAIAECVSHEFGPVSILAYGERHVIRTQSEIETQISIAIEAGQVQFITVPKKDQASIARCL